MKKNIFILAALTLAFAACQHEPVDPTTLYMPENEVESYVEAQEGVLLTLNEFVDTYMTEEGNFMNWKANGLPCPYRTRSTNGDGVYLFSIDTLPVGGQPIYIRGRVVTEDHAGNFYKSMVIQQIVNGEQQALRLSIDASSINGQYAMGQEILIKVNGFSIGRYANQPQLCVPAYNNNIHANNAEQKVGWAPGRIPGSRFYKATTLVGTPDKSKIIVDTLSIADFIKLNTQKDFRTWDGKLVCLENVWFTGQYAGTQGDLSNCSTGDPEKDGNANVFAPTTNNIGYPQSRVITDGTSFTNVSTSEYAKFARFYLPGCNANGVSGASDYKGSITGILGYYRDNAKYQTDEWDWSITIRSLSNMGWGTEQDINLYNDEREEWTPEEYGIKK